MHPDYLQHARQSFLSADDEAEFVASCGLPLRKSIRVNTLKISVEAFTQIALRYGWQITPIPWCSEGFWIDIQDDNKAHALGNTFEHLQGLFYIQEASSMLPAAALFGETAESETTMTSQPLVVDMAAAPGSKTTQIAAMLNNQGVILANELSASRLKFLSSNLIRCGVTNTLMSHHDAVKIGDWMPQQFDYVLLDAPCGGEGTVRKDFEALKDWSLEKVKQLAQLQKRLILSAYAALKPGGRMVYSTCTLSPEENHQVADYLLENTDAIVQPLDQLFVGADKVASDKGYLLMLPHQFDCEGFFIACFSKPETASKTAPLETIFTSPFVELSAKTKKQVVQYYQQHFGLSLDIDGYQLLQRDKEIWLFPDKSKLINSFIKVNRAGLKIAQVFPNKIRSTHEFSRCFGNLAEKQIVVLSKEQFEQFIQGLNLEVESSEIQSGEVLLSYQNQIVGVGQNQKGRIKNGLPRDLVKDNFKLA